MLRVDRAEDVVRYASGSKIDGDKIDGSAFVARPQDNGQLSVNRPNVFGPDLEVSLDEIRSCSRLQLRASGRFAQVNIEEVCSALSELRPISAVEVIEDQLPQEGDFPADPSHALMVGLPNADDLMADMCGGHNCQLGEIAFAPCSALITPPPTAPRPRPDPPTPTG